MAIDLLDPALTAAWRRADERRRAALRIDIASARGVDPRTIKVVEIGRRLAVSLRPVPAQLELPLLPRP